MSDNSGYKIMFEPQRREREGKFKHEGHGTNTMHNREKGGSPEHEQEKNSHVFEYYFWDK